MQRYAESPQKAFRRAVLRSAAEGTYKVASQDIKGSLPDNLTGSIIISTAGQLQLGPEEDLLHPWDGNGYVAKIVFKADGSVQFTGAFVRTPLYEQEQAAGKVLRRGFASSKGAFIIGNTFDVKEREVANQSVIQWGGRVIAGGNNSRPFSLDPRNLTTLGRSDLGTLPSSNVAPFFKVVTPPPPAVEDSITIMTGEDEEVEVEEMEWDGAEAEAGEEVLVGYEWKSGLLSTDVEVTEWSSQWRPLRRQRHSFADTFLLPPRIAVSSQYILFLQNSLTTDFPRYLVYALGVRPKTWSIDFDSERPLQVFALSRSGLGKGMGQGHRRYQSTTQFIGSVGNAYDIGSVAEESKEWLGKAEESGVEVAFDAISYVEYDLDNIDPLNQRDTFPKGRLFRFFLNIDKAQMRRRLLCSLACDFPVYNPNFATRPTRFVYAAAALTKEFAFPFTAVVKCDTALTGPQDPIVAIWTAAEGEYVSGITFVPAAASEKSPSRNGQVKATSESAVGEDDGWVVAYVLDAVAGESRVVVLDARDLTVVAAVPLAGTHGFLTSISFVAPACEPQ